MKILFILVVLMGGLKAVADDTVCQPWVQDTSVTCIFGDGEDGSSWARTCSYGSSTCKPHRQDPPGTPCQADTICMGRDQGDVTDPNNLLNICTDWRLAAGSNVACPGGQSRWVRACTMEHLGTKTCSAEQPPNIP